MESKTVKKSSFFLYICKVNAIFADKLYKLTMKMNDSGMVVKCYLKSELAGLYFPDLSADSAVRKLMRWIKRCTDLMDELLKLDYRPASHTFSAREVRLIVYYLGEP